MYSSTFLFPLKEGVMRIRGHDWLTSIKIGYSDSVKWWRWAGVVSVHFTSCMGCEDMFARVFNFDVKWKWIVVFRHRPFNLWVKILRYPLNMKMVGPQVLWTIWRREKNCVFRESKSGSLDIPSHDTNIFFYILDVFLKKKDVLQQGVNKNDIPMRNNGKGSG